MINSSKPYQNNKESGTAWLGRVPAHWTILPNRALFSEVKDRDHPDEPMLSVTITRGVIPQRALLEDTSKKDGSNLDRSAYKLVQPGDIAYNKMRAWQGAIGLSELRGIISPAYVVQRPRSKGANRYFHFLFRTPQFAKEAERWSYGITSDMWSLRPEHFRMIYSPLPPEEEREAIVRFLDHYDRLIRRHIAAKRKLIALLNEQRRAIIYNAVRRGLDPDVPLKSTSVPWLGDIPRHWDLSRVKNEFRCLNSRRVPLSSTQRGEMTLRQYDYYGASGVIDKVDDYLFDDNLLLIAEDGANLVLRNLPLAIIARGRFWVNNHAHILKPTRGNLEYLANLMESLSFLPWISGAAQPKLTKDRLMSIDISVPPVQEQKAIMNHIESRTKPQTDAISRTKHEIELILEFRTRLISDVVIGKLDVREAAVTLPELPPELSEDQSLQDDSTSDSDVAEDEATVDQLTTDYAD